MVKKTEKTSAATNLNNSKFAQMLEDAANQYRIPHYGDLSDNMHFEVVKPCLISNKYVTYQIKRHSSNVWRRVHSELVGRGGVFATCQFLILGVESA